MFCNKQAQGNYFENGFRKGKVKAQANFSTKLFICPVDRTTFNPVLQAHQQKLQRETRQFKSIR